MRSEGRYITISVCVLAALSYPKAILSRAMNYETKEMLTYVSFPFLLFCISEEFSRINSWA